MNLLRSLTRTSPAISLAEWVNYFTFGGHQYPLFGLQQTLTGNREEIDPSYVGFARQAYEANNVVFACIATRLALFSEARFQFQRMNHGRPGDLYGTPALSVLERPWPGGTTGDLLARALLDYDLGGNAFLVRRPNRIRRLRPDWVTLVGGSPIDDDADLASIDAELLGLIYHPGGKRSGRPTVSLLREEFAHFAGLTPDPLSPFRGMSWLTPIVREVAADSAATSHKLRFFENGATPNMVVSLDKESTASVSPQAFKDWVDKFRAEAEPKGLMDAYKTMYLGAGASVTVVGKDLQQLDFKVTQGAGETRIASAAGVHPVIVGLSEGLQGSSLNAGNFGAARRLVADRTMHPLWRNMAGSLEVIVPAPSGSRLWVDTRDIPFLREDRKDAAEIQRIKSVTIRQLVDAGYEAKSVVAAVEAEDMGLLVHSGLFSVQLQEPGAPTPDDPAVTAGRALAALMAPHLQREPTDA